jgi:hypothetical protein
MRHALLVLVIAAGACGSKKPDHDELCSTAKTVVMGGLKDQADQLEKSGDNDSAMAVRRLAPTIDKRWDDFCRGLSDKDIDCLGKGAEAFTNPDCKHAVEAMKTRLLGM